MRGWLSLLLCLVSCQTVVREVTTGQPLVIQNVYANPTYPHHELFQVLLFPLQNPLNDEWVHFHRHRLTKRVLSNFGKFHYFSLQYDPQFILPSEEILNLHHYDVHRMKLGAIGDQYHVQAVLIMSILDFSPFPPMHLQLHALLLDANMGERIWECKQTFDLRDTEVINRMRLWWNTRRSGGLEKESFTASLIEPNVFVDFVFYILAKSYGEVRIENARLLEKAREEWEDSIAKRGS